MKPYARPAIMILAAIGLATSIASLYVHYQMLADPAYSSFCNINETVSCEAVLGSQYSWLFGVPVAAGGAIWSALVLMLAWRGMSAPKSDHASAVAGYIFVLSTLGLAVTLYLAYTSFVVIGKACPLCLAMYVSVIGTFIVSGGAAAGLGTLPSRLGRDLGAAFSSTTAAALAIVWIVASASLVAFFPKPAPAVAVGADGALPPAAAPTEVLTADQLAQFETWIAAQPRTPLPVQADGAQVVVVKFNDYQCPSCRQAYLEYRGIYAKYEAQAAGRVRFISLDFPLEAECNIAAIHPSACEAAAAVRMAKAKGKEAAMEEWLFVNQSTMTPASVKEGLAQVAQVTDFDAQYPKVLEAVRADAKIGRDLNITGTPTFYINGIKVPSLRAAYFDALIASELKRAESPATPD